jgi:hypothetical protein
VKTRKQKEIFAMAENFFNDNSRKYTVLDGETIIAVFRFETDTSDFVADHGSRYMKIREFVTPEEMRQEVKAAVEASDNSKRRIKGGERKMQQMHHRSR